MINCGDEQIRDYAKLCELIFNINPMIRHAAVYHESGEKLAGGMRDGLTSLLPKIVTEQSIHMAIIRWNTRKMFSQYIGKCKYAMAEYEKIKRITLPLEDKILLLVSLEKEAHHDVIIEQILKLCAC